MLANHSQTQYLPSKILSWNKPWSDVQEIIENYRLGNLTAVEKISSGLMHRTHRISATSGVYFLQCLHPKLSSQEILDDYVPVTQHLQRKGFEAPRVITTRDGRFLVCDQSERMWRLTSAVRGETFEKVTSCEQALEGAVCLDAFMSAWLISRMISNPIITPRHRWSLSEVGASIE